MEIINENPVEEEKVGQDEQPEVEPSHVDEAPEVEMKNVPL